MRTKQTTMKILVSTACILAILPLLVSASPADLPCPRGCHCLVDPSRPNERKLSCKWSHIPASLPNMDRPDALDSVRSLSIRCSNRRQTSNLESAVFGLFPNLRTLDLHDCRSAGNRLSGNFLRGLTQLRALNLQRVQPQRGRLTLARDALVDLERLEKLTIKQSRLASFPSWLLCRLPELRMLDLAENVISDLKQAAQNSGECSGQLLLLNLTANRIAKLNKDDLKPLAPLMVLVLSQNRISTVHQEAFATAVNLKELYLDSNLLSAIDNLPTALSRLDLSKNKLTTIPAVIADVDSLRQILLADNQIATIDSGAFSVNNTLQLLNLKNNHLASIPANGFERLLELQVLDLSGNQLQSLETGTFWKLRQLELVNLANNRLRGVNSSHLEGLSNVATLDLSNNSLIGLSTDVFGELKAAKVISLRDNLLSDIPASLATLHHLATLDLSLNQIATIRKGLFTSLPNLEHLNISANRLTTVERYVFEDMQRLQLLDLSANNIARLSSRCFSRCLTLATVRLDRNRIASVDGVFASLARLNELNMTANQITVLPIGELPSSLKTLLVQQNRLRQLFGSARHLTALTLGDFAENQLEQLSADNIPPGLEQANFANNTITRVLPSTFAHCPKLQSVDLSGNQLTTLPLDVFASGRAVRVSAAGNRFDCDCAVGWMRSQTPGLQRAQVVDVQRIKCRNILTDELKLIQETMTDEFLCEYESVCRTGCPCCRFRDCGCNNICPEGCSCYHDKHETANIVKCTGVRVDTTALPMDATGIYIDGANINRLQSNAFLSLYKLKKLVLNDNGITHIEKAAFKNLNDLQVLDISHNNLTAITGNEIDKAVALESVFLNHNQLTQVHLKRNNLPMLKYLTLHQNRLVELPSFVTTGQLSGLSLAENPWRCDCQASTYLSESALQYWLPSHRDIVEDQERIYCQENLTETRSNNRTTALSALPPTEGNDIVKVQFWTFASEINRTMCRDGLISGEEGADGEKSDNLTPLVIIFLSLLALAAAFLCLLVLVRCCCRHLVSSSKRKSPASLNSSQTTSTPIPLLNYDTFIAYSDRERKLVEDDLTPYLQQQGVEVCLLHRELRGVMQHPSNRVVISDDLIEAMRRSQSLIVCISPAFLRQEWQRPDVCTAVKTFVQSRRKLLFVLMPDYRPEMEMDQSLGHFLRTNTHIYWTDGQLRGELLKAIPSSGGSAAYESFGGNASTYDEFVGRKVDWV